MKKAKITFIGGDLRQIAAARTLSADGNDVTLYGFDDLKSVPSGIVRENDIAAAEYGADVIVLPLPYGHDGKINCPLTKEEIMLRTVTELCGNALILGGKFDRKAYGIAAAHNNKMTDYYEREELSVLNAVPTAEGAVEIAMRELPITVFGMKTAVIGYGRVGAVLASTLRALGADVTVAARSPSARAWAKINGCTAVGINELPAVVGDFSCVFNTVPALVVDGSVTDAMRQDALIIDLASAPGGVDTGAAEKAGIKCISALSLPGRVAPDTAGEIIAETIENILIQEDIIQK